MPNWDGRWADRWQRVSGQQRRVYQLNHSTITPNALLRGKHFERAFVRTSKQVVSGLKAPSPDDWWAEKLRYRIEPDKRGHCLVIPEQTAKRVGVGRGRGSGRLYYALTFVNLGHDPDVIYESRTKEGRTIFRGSYLMRLHQNLWIGLAQPYFEQYVFCGNSHAYRPERSRFTALAEVRRSVKRGYVWILTVDVRKFFLSIPLDFVEYVLGLQLPNFTPELRRLAIWTMRDGMIARLPVCGDTGWYPAPEVLLPGQPIAGLLSNAVGTAVIDSPFAEMYPRDLVRLVRYSDNILLQAKDPEVLSAAGKDLETWLAHFGLLLHEHQGPLDVRQDPALWLGKELRGGTVKTTTDGFEKIVRSLVDCDPCSKDFRFRVGCALEESSLDTQRAVQLLLERPLQRESRTHAQMFRDIARRAKRKVYLLLSHN